MTDTNSSGHPRNYWKYLFISLLLAIILCLVGFVSYRAGISQSQNTKPTTMPEVTLSPTPILIPSGDTIPTTLTPSLTSTISPTNTPTSTPTPTSAPKADLYIKDYTFNHPPKVGEPFTVSIGIFNKGNESAPAFKWEWRAMTLPLESPPQCGQKINGLGAQTGVMVFCTYTYSRADTYKTRAKVDTENVVAESDESNNLKVQDVTTIP